jgi:hypothetical protein
MMARPYVLKNNSLLTIEQPQKDKSRYMRLLL